MPKAYAGLALIFQDVLTEIERAEEKHPGWHDDPVRAGMVVAEESGEATKAILNYVEFVERVEREELYVSPGNAIYLRKQVDEEMIQTAAMVFRFLLNWRHDHDRT